MALSYDLGLVVMSIVVAMVASYTALDLAGRVASAESRAARLWWLGGGAASMGMGIWSMHFIGMLAVRMPIPLGYDPALTAVSLLIAIGVSGLALGLVGRETLSRPVLLAGGVVMGAGICGMHYTGMAAMRMVPPIRYDPLLFGASVLVAVTASFAALWLAFTLRAVATSKAVIQKILAAMVMGVAISGMHYTSMAAARFAPNSVYTAAIRLHGDNSFLGHSLGLIVLAVLLLTLLAVILDARIGSRTARLLRTVETAYLELQREMTEKERTRASLRESEEKCRMLLETATDAVVTMDESGVIRYANTAVARIFGYAPEEVVGKELTMLQPERLRSLHMQGFRRYLETGVKKLDWRATETCGLTRDGREFPVEIAFSSMVLEGKRLFAGFIRDISERKEREARIVRLNRVYAVLSGINGLIVRARNRRELFEGACRIAVEQGQFRMAMIGIVNSDEIKPAAFRDSGGGDAAQILRIGLSGADLNGEEPAARALREQRVYVCHDIAAEPSTEPWREEALEHGYRSSAMFPLVVNRRLAGCLGLYAGEPGVFDEEEMKLLGELAGDIAYAMEFIARDEQLDYLAYYDPLTGLANRRLFGDRLNQYVQTARQNGTRLAVLLADLERFKSVNDTLGTEAGDAVLKAVAARVTRLSRNAQRVARVGDDLFAAVVPELARPQDLSMLLEDRIWKSAWRPFRLNGHELRLSAKVGVALFPDDGDDADSLFRNAEAALKKAKASGERCLFYSREMSHAIRERLNLEGKLRRALEREEFILYYQPKVDLRDGHICGAEALLRWNSPDLGLIPPLRFVPLLEETGLIVEAGRWVLERAAADLKRWRDEGLRTPRIAVNVSSVQLRRPDFVETVRAAVGLAESDTPRIELEITESVLLADIEQHIGKLKAVRDMGVPVAIDDFGTGYSSLAYLSKLPVNAVKIDHSFIVRMTDSADTMNIVSTIISLAHSMNLKVIAEGVDSPEQLKFLRLLHCDEMQGFLFSKSLPPEEFAHLLREDRRLAL